LTYLANIKFCKDSSAVSGEKQTDEAWIWMGVGVTVS